MISRIWTLDLARAPSEEALLAYVDGQLAPRERARVESYLARHPEEAKRVESYRQQNRLLHGAFDAAYAQPLPPEIAELTREVGDRLYPPRRTFQSLRVAASLLLAAVVGAAAWEGYRQVAEPERLAALQGYLQQGVRLAADQWRDDPTAPMQVKLEELPTVEPAATTPSVPDSSGRAPDLRSLGLELTAVRMLAGDTPGAMELIYETEERARVLLYFSPTDVEGSSRFSMLQEGSLSMLFWHQQGRSFGLISELDRDRLLAVGTAVQEAWRDQPAPSVLQPQPGAAPSDPGSSGADEGAGTSAS